MSLTRKGVRDMAASFRPRRILVAGHRGMVGSALLRRLTALGYDDLLTPTRQQLDLLDGGEVQRYLLAQRPDYIFMAAAKVGGIAANNQFRAEFLRQNLAIATNLIHGAHEADVQRLMYFGSSCIYPRDCRQPLREEDLLTGPLEPTNEPYAIAKIAGIKLCENYNRQYARQYVSVMPTNLYGPNDNYDLASGHVLAALIRKAHEARQRDDDAMVVWGSGTPRREFLYADDLAEACVHLMEIDYDGPLLNIGSGAEVTIADLARTVMRVVGFEGALVFDASRPDGTPRKLLDTSRIRALGWQPRTALAPGISLAYAHANGAGKLAQAAVAA